MAEAADEHRTDVRSVAERAAREQPRQQCVDVVVVGLGPPQFGGEWAE